MKAMLLGLMTFALAGTAFGMDRTGLDNQIILLTAKFDAMQRNPAQSIPAETLRRAKGIILLDRTKAGFVFAYQGGSGIAMVRDKRAGRWSPAAFFTANEASLGFQIGGQQSFVVILLMNTNAAHNLTEPRFQFSGEARGTAGDSSAGVEGSVAPDEPSVLVFDSRQGLYGGAAVKGGSIAPDTKANCVYYGQAITTGEILFDHKVKPTQTVLGLAEKIDQISRLARK